MAVDNIASKQYCVIMPWTLIYLDEYMHWLDGQVEDLQDEALAHLEMLKNFGPGLGRPYVDTLKGSRLANLKELRFEFQNAVIRILFAFDPKRQGVIILGGDKSGDKRWYEKKIPIAERLFDLHLEKQRKEDEARKKGLKVEEQKLKKRKRR